MKSNKIELTIKSSIFDRPRKLVIDRNFIEFEDKDRVGVMNSRFEKEEIEGIRYGVVVIWGYAFVIGRIYCVDVKSEKGGMIKIRIKSLYGINRKSLNNKYSKIINALFDYYYADVVRNYLGLFKNNLEFNLLGVIFTKDGIYLRKNESLIEWTDLGTKDYRTYYALFQKTNPNYYRAFEYLEEWNTIVLHSVSRHILIEKKFLEN
jgi:hypothetical protein